jgi:hypothetical protein
MSQRDWQKSKMYCRRCGEWGSNLPHRECPQGAKGSLVWVDTAGFALPFMLFTSEETIEREARK